MPTVADDHKWLCVLVGFKVEAREQEEYENADSTVCRSRVKGAGLPGLGIIFDLMYTRDTLIGFVGTATVTLMRWGPDTALVCLGHGVADN